MGCAEGAVQLELAGIVEESAADGEQHVLSGKETEKCINEVDKRARTESLMRVTSVTASETKRGMTLQCTQSLYTGYTVQPSEHTTASPRFALQKTHKKTDVYFQQLVHQV